MKDKDWVLDFGKYKGRTISYLLFYNPDYLLWCLRNTDRLNDIDTIIEEQLKDYEHDKMGTWDEDYYLFHPY